MENFKDYWENIYKENKTINLYDGFLDKYLKYFKKENFLILDLGSGNGTNSLFLLDKGYDVISLDFSSFALNELKEKNQNAKIIEHDLLKDLPFEKESVDLVIADLSLHYFSKEDTLKIINNIDNILKKDGILIARVNSVKELKSEKINKKIEDNFYFINGYNKRFFSSRDINFFFNIFSSLTFEEKQIIKYKKKKYILEIFAIK